MVNKKGAMFGLDARIALAIFGALSVISGAALYSAIEKAKMQTVISFYSETAKAIEAYVLDTASLMPYHATRTQSFNINELVESSVSGWKGPYVSQEAIDCFSATKACLNITSIQKADGGNSYLSATSKKDGIDGYDSKIVNCTSGVDCTVWLHIQYINSSLAKAVDEYIDGSVDPGAGRIRMPTPSQEGTNIFYNTGISVDQLK